MGRPASPFNFCGDVRAGAETRIKEIFAIQLGERLAIVLKMIRLPADGPLPIEAEPCKVLVNCVFECRFAATLINVFDAEQKPTLTALGPSTH